MQYFMETSDTIVDGVGFSHYSSCHLLWLSAFLLIGAAVCFAYRRCDEAGRRRWRRVIAALIVADELYKILFLCLGGNYRAAYLPLHLCSINIFLIVIHAVKPSKVLDNFLYTVCLPSALLALLFPTWTKLPPANFMHIHSFTVHILLGLYPLMLFVGGDIRPRARFIPHCVALLVGLALPVWGFNLLFDTNFMFLIRADKGNPLYWFEQNWGSHLFGFPVLVPVVLLVMYLPIEAYWYWRRRKKVAKEEAV